jgi:hypothetical protein
MKIRINLDVFKDLPTDVRKLSNSQGAEFGDVLADLAKRGLHRHGKARDHFEVEEDERDAAVYPDDGFNGDAFDVVYSRRDEEQSTACNFCLSIAGFEKPRVKGIGEDGFRAILNEERARRGLEAFAADKVPPPSKAEHAKHRAKVDNSAQIKKAQDNKMKKQASLQAMQTRLRKMSKRPTNPEQAKVWADRRQALMDKIKEQRDSIRFTDSRIAKMRSTE